MSQLFASGDQSIGAAASASVLPVNIQVNFFRIDWFDLVAVQGLSVYSAVPQWERISSLVLSLLYGPTLIFIHDYWKKS